MNIIWFSKTAGKARHLNLTHPVALVVLGLLGLAILAGAFSMGLNLGARDTGQTLSAREANRLYRIIKQEKQQISQLRGLMQERVDAVAMRLGEINAHVIRLNALGKRLTELADIDHRELNFDHPPAMGGPESEGLQAQIPDLTQMLNSLEQRVDLRDAQLAALENVILARKLKEATVPDGRPVRSGFISSYFGERQDPFTGHQAFHRGVDFSGSMGDDVLAVATGVVSFAGDRSGFGSVIEINHGAGYVTRYAHNQRTLVAPGQTVSRGQAIALMGTSGRSTGPHVHFEVLHHGKPINPLSFIGP
jgi:murein DD-endopeptidase MepM/ murein hydrolase activator NlpD